MGLQSIRHDSNEHVLCKVVFRAREAVWKHDTRVQATRLKERGLMGILGGGQGDRQEEREQSGLGLTLESTTFKLVGRRLDAMPYEASGLSIRRCFDEMVH